MNHRDLFIYWVTLTTETILGILVYSRSLQQRLPFFAAYITTLLTCTILLGPIYHFFGYRSGLVAYYAGWTSVSLNLFARCLAIVELCHYRLRAYQGIWALTWRLLALLAMVFLVHATADAWGQPNRLVIYGLVIERDVGISSLLILMLALWVRNYYGISFDPVQKACAIGLCLLAVIDLVNNTLLQYAFTGYLASWFHTDFSYVWPDISSKVEEAAAFWGLVRTIGLVAAGGIWCYALREPLPAPAEDPVLLPAAVYEEMSPAINLRLRTFNDRLLELLKP
jgi:hypothetical protein